MKAWEAHGLCGAGALARCSCHNRLLKGMTPAVADRCKPSDQTLNDPTRGPP